jgi:fructose-bisphosphate aldolase class I
LARYAALSGSRPVPIVEPEVLMDGEAYLGTLPAVTEEVLHVVFDQLYEQSVMLEGLILKPNMVVPGLGCSEQETVMRWPTQR